MIRKRGDFLLILIALTLFTVGLSLQTSRELQLSMPALDTVTQTAMRGTTGHLQSSIDWPASKLFDISEIPPAQAPKPPPPPPAPKVDPKELLKKYQLVGVIGVDDRRIAVVKETGAADVRFIRAGDALGEFLAEAIFAQSLTVLFGDVRLELSLPLEKQPPAP